MDIKKRRRRRIATLIIVTLVIVGGLAGVMWLQRVKREKEAQWHRGEGMAALEAGDHAAAIEHLGKFLERHPEDDAAALHAFAKANLEVPQPRNAHIRYALGSLQQAVALDPENHDAARELIELYRLVGANEQTLELANRLLNDNPTDARAMGDKAIALSRLEKVEEAHDAALEAVRLDPDNYRLHLILLQVRRQMKTPKEELIAYGAEQAAKHPDDPRFELVAGLASALAGDEATDAAKGWLRQAAGRPLTDARLAADLVAVLDTLGMWSESIAVLKQAADLGDVNMATDYARRLLEAERFTELADRFAAEDGTRTPKLEQQVLRAMALHNLGRHEEVGAVLAAIAQRKDSPLAPVWAEVLGKVYHPELEPPKRVEAIKEAMTTIIDNAYLHAFLGDAYSSLGDNEMALQHWQRAAELRTPWGGVRLLVARAMLNANRPKDAVGYAEAALVRMPDSLPAAVTVIRSRAEAMGTIDGDTPTRLIELVEKVQRVAPGEPQTLIAKVDMLPRVGRKEEAKALALELVNREQGLPQQLLGRLAEVSRRHSLGIEEQLQQQYATQMEGTPELALSEATGLARRGQAADGLALLDKGLVEAPAAEKLSWELARAAYLDAVGDPSAAATWVKLADNNAGDRRVQQMAMRAQSVQADRAFTERVLGRLQTLMGEDNVPWLTEKARWLAGSGMEGDATQAVTMLRQVIERAPKRVEPRILLAQTLVQLNRPQLAIQELRAAEQAVPRSIDLWLELARLYQSQRDFPNALNYLDLALASPELDDGDRREAASLLARQGEHGRAIQLVERLAGDDGGTPDEQLLLASLYSRAGRTADAEKLMPALLEQSTPQSLAVALDFYATQGRDAEVQEVLSRVEAAPMPEAARQRLLGEHAARTGELDKALRHFASASDVSPKDAELWRQRVRLHLMQGQGQEAITVAQAGLKQVPADAGLKAIVDHAQLVTAYAGDVWGRRLLLGMVEDATLIKPAAEGLRAIASATAGDRQAAAAVATRLGELARANPKFLSLQLLAARKSLEVGQATAAVDIATRASASFPEAVEALAMQAEALASAGRWADALAAAAEWGKRSGDAPLAADVMMAEAHLQLDQPERALQRLEPHAAAARANPDAYRDVVTRRLRALVALKRYDEAMAVLAPLLPASPVWRAVTMDLASSRVADADVAADWLRRASAPVAPADINERMLVAQSWWALSQRLPDAALTGEAQRVVAEVTAQPDAPAAAWHMRGVIAEQAGDLSAAEEAYREALRREPGLGAAKNNLAMVLAQRASDASEALRLAQGAVEGEPENAAFLDTLAFVQAKAGQTDAAVQTMQKVINLEPTTKAWYENLAQILRDAGKPDEAQKVLDQYETRALRM